MKICLLGATGGTGAAFLRLALVAGHQVTAVVRTPAKVDIHLDDLRVIRGDVRDRASLAAAMEDQEAVVATFGVAGLRNAMRATDLYSAGITNVLAAMNECGVRRLIMVSSSAVVYDPSAPFVWNRILRPMCWRMYTDMSNMELLIAESDLDWTIARPPQLVDGPARGDLKIAAGTIPRGASKVRREDLAQFLLDELEQGKFVRQKPFVMG